MTIFVFVFNLSQKPMTGNPNIPDKKDMMKRKRENNSDFIGKCTASNDLCDTFV